MKLKSFFILLAVLFIAGCSLPENTIRKDTKTINITKQTARLIEAENDFGFELFQHVFSSETRYENIMVSPLSVSLALAMTYNGADGETKAAMGKALKIQGLTPQEINNSYFDLINSLKSLDPKVLLEIANAIFYRDDFEVESKFMSINKTYYDSEISALDFEAQLQALKTINGWVTEKTHDKIQSIIDRISPQQVMFLVNAIYFKGTWQKEFNEDRTKKLPFYLENGESVKTETMQRLDTLPYMSNDLFSAVKLPYGTENYNMYIFLPEKGKTLQEIAGKLNKDNWETWMKNFQLTERVDIKFPRFKYSYDVNLNDALTKMGMGIALSGAADFSGINKNRNLHIDFVKHKSFIEVNEEGTEAAAVTSVGVRMVSIGNSPKTIPFHVNRPFFYAITEKSTDAVLFMGTVKNPQLN
ncbi:serpin family protein [Mariniphaga sediminis]|uniref:Serpin family protein n=1 Tax=Mariniphaga sediminis TaxID=1628158 RepID=A0A399D0K3_9BACT|nr:serpin family protein [Mariniphaga sediminis]RIH63900.1 serpin family protein [Mariniphaga sediminis]